jgi:hypothetical protein
MELIGSARFAGPRRPLATRSRVSSGKTRSPLGCRVHPGQSITRSVTLDYGRSREERPSGVRPAPAATQSQTWKHRDPARQNPERPHRGFTGGDGDRHPVRRAGREHRPEDGTPVARAVGAAASGARRPERAQLHRLVRNRSVDSGEAKRQWSPHQLCDRRRLPGGSGVRDRRRRRGLAPVPGPRDSDGCARLRP